MHNVEVERPGGGLPPETPLPILDNSQREAVKAALRWAIRGATMRGTVPPAPTFERN